MRGPILTCQAFALSATLCFLMGSSATGQDSRDGDSRRQSLVAATKAARQLREESRDTFVRGLLPVTDHLEHLSSIYEAEGRAAYDAALQKLRRGANYEDNKPPQLSPQELQRTVQPVIQARLDALQDAVERLDAFKQPASAGWEADVALARLALSQAQVDAAKLLGKPPAEIVSLTAAERQTAAEHYWKRLADADVGLASVPAMIQAVALLNVAPELRRNFYREAADRTVVWASVGAGIGRRDAVTRAELDLTWLKGYAKGADGALHVDDRAWRESDRFAQTLFEQRMGYYPKGTASLSDLTEAWSLRQRMHQIAADAEYRLPPASRDQHLRNLKALEQTASATEDLRGRNAPDVTFVRLLSDLRTAD